MARYCSVRRSSLTIILFVCVVVALFPLRRSNLRLQDVIRTVWLLRGNDLTVAEGENWYRENQEELMAINTVLLDNPEIQKVRQDATSDQILKYCSSLEAMPVYRKLEGECECLGIELIDVARDYDRLICVEYVLSSSGLSVSGGKSLSISFVPDETIIDRIYSAPDHLVEPLDKEGWYLVDYEDARRGSVK